MPAIATCHIAIGMAGRRPYEVMPVFAPATLLAGTYRAQNRRRLLWDGTTATGCGSLGSVNRHQAERRRTFRERPPISVVIAAIAVSHERD
jgi:hypothetical protein